MGEALIARTRVDRARPPAVGADARCHRHLCVRLLEQRRVLGKAVERVAIDRRIQLVLEQLAAERLGPVGEQAVGLAQEEMRRGVGGVGFHRFDGFGGAPRFEAELPVDFRQADAGRSVVAIEQQAAAVDRTIVVAGDGVLQLAQGGHLAILIALEQTGVEPRRRVAWIETLGRGQGRQTFRKRRAW